MSDSVEKTAGGATRGLFGSFSFILVMLGLEMVTDKAGIQLGLGLFLIMLGALCAYTAFFWESAKKVLSNEAQLAIGGFAQSRTTWGFMIFLVLNVLIFSRFIEEHRWPFSYPADPATIAENAKLKNDRLNVNAAFFREKELADKWRFTSVIRQVGACQYQIQVSQRAFSTINFWQELFRAGGWNGVATPQSGLMQPGITLRIGSDGSPCAAALQRAFTDIYPSPPSRIAPNQQTGFLGSCGEGCVQVEIDY